MRKRNLFFVCMLLIGALIPIAQKPLSSKMPRGIQQSKSMQKISANRASHARQQSQQSGNAPSSFQQFRQGILDDYDSFRNEVLENYAQYLEGIWVEFQSFKAEVRDTTPKFTEPPIVDNSMDSIAKMPQGTSVLPTPEVSEGPQPTSDDQPASEPQPAREQKSAPAPAARHFSQDVNASVTGGNQTDRPEAKPLPTRKHHAKARHVDEEYNVPDPSGKTSDRPEPKALANKVDQDREARQRAAELAARQEAERQAAEQRAAELAAKQEAERQTAELAERRKAERKAAKQKAERRKAERQAQLAAQQEAERQAAELAAQQAAARQAAELAAAQHSAPQQDTQQQSSGRQFAFDFHTLKLQVPEVDITLMQDIPNQRDYARQWKALAKNEDIKPLIDNLEKLAKDMNLNDYLAYDMTAAFVSARFPNVSANSRISLVHFLMANMGYDVRLCNDEFGRAMLALPVVQTVYGRAGVQFYPNDKTRHYLFADYGEPPVARAGKIYTCQMPAASNAGKKVDLHLSKLNIPYQSKPYKITFGDITIEGETNANIYPLLVKYPQMAIPEYAASEILPDVRGHIVGQLKEQLAGRPQHQAVDALLQFVQNAFVYATDQEFHGYEKPYFFEEMLFYPKCDCEDRAIFYTYLLWNVLGVKNHLLNYPGHESASVHLDDTCNGDAYKLNGEIYYISDPTYIGSVTGMCMPDFRTVSPKIDYQYK